MFFPASGLCQGAYASPCTSVWPHEEGVLQEWDCGGESSWTRWGRFISVRSWHAYPKDYAAPPCIFSQRAWWRWGSSLLAVSQQHHRTLALVTPPVSPDPVPWMEVAVARGAWKYLLLYSPMELQEPVTQSSSQEHLTFVMFPQHPRPPVWVQMSPGEVVEGVPGSPTHM